MHEASPGSAHMCELEPSIYAVPDIFITGVGFVELPVSIKYLQQDILGEFIDCHGGHPRQHSKITSITTERP